MALIALIQADDCIIACPYSYDPVCAKAKTGNGKAQTFGNECAIRAYACQTKTGENIVDFHLEDTEDLRNSLSTEYEIVSQGECPWKNVEHLQLVNG